MFIITKNIKIIQERKNLSLKKLASLLNYNHGALSSMINGKKAFPDGIIEKLLPILKVSEKTFEKWIFASKYSEQVFEIAIQSKKDHGDNPENIVTTNIDKILKTKNLSRTKAAEQISISQNGLNNAVMIGVLSKNMIKKLSPLLEVSEEDLQAWNIADKYTLKEIEQALALHEKNPN